MKKLYLSILWHQHQPYYKDDSDGSIHLPWVYLHALKDYYEMARHVENSGNVKATFNYVPSLLIQMDDYAKPNNEDIFLKILRIPTAKLTPDERWLVSNQCFMANIDNMIRPLKRFSELYNKFRAADRDISSFSSNEILDLEVVYLLAWTGVFMRWEEPVAVELLQKGHAFTEEDKNRLLDASKKWIGKIKDIHKRLAEKGLIELTCTPFYHPILPLLADIRSAKEAYSEVALPNFDADLESDADWQIREGLAEFEKQMGVKARGMWPAEGSISQKTAKKYAENNVDWIASDEEVLGNSLKLNLRDNANRHLLYRKRFQIHNGQKLNIFFRDKALSDLIGFTYSGWKEEDAVKDFISHLRKIYDSVNFSPHVSVILDGENAWEYYKNNGYDFFTQLYYALGHTDWIETQTFSESIKNQEIPEELLSNIVAGSWIMGNFKIWIGHAEKNRAWELIASAKQSISLNIDKADDETKAQIYKELHIAEGSDWFWWFGDDHFTVQADIFDKLFRTHLVNIYRLMKVNVPQELFQPIKAVSKTGTLRKPSDFITPTIDGEVTSFYEWLSAGEFDLKSDTGSMHAGGDNLRKLFYGFDKKNLYLWVNTDFRNGFADILEIEMLAGSGRSVITVPLLHGIAELEGGVKAGLARILEVLIPLASTDKIYLIFRLKKDGAVIEKAPLYNALEIDISQNFDDDWVI